MSKFMGVGIVGCGNISAIYIHNISHLLNHVRIVSIYDLNLDKAKAVAYANNLQVQSFNDMLSNDEIDIILNITPPLSHYDICRQALLAGKHVYVEKPMSITYSEANDLMDIASGQNLQIGIAPDTFLGNPVQAAKAYIDSGNLGRIVGCNARFSSSGPEKWHPAPTFFYKKGAGPLMDMGPYYITILIYLLGEIIDVQSLKRRTFDRRKVTAENRSVDKLEVEVDTHILANLLFKNGAIGQLLSSFDIHSVEEANHIEIYGEKGTMILPNPNWFEGSVKVCVGDTDNLVSHDIYANDMPEANYRGIGLDRMAEAIMNHHFDLHEASGEIGLKVIKVIEDILK